VGTTLNIPQYTEQFVGTVTSVAASITGNAIGITGSPITSSGTLAFAFAGNATQYVRGDGALATLPTNGGGGGASVSYYLNGSINQGTIGGITYYEMNKTPIIGAGTDFSRSSNGYIASFLTDANDPALLNIPAGNWNFETYFQASSGGGSPTFYIELYKYDGTTFTLIASNSGSPKLINDGTNIEAYFSALAVPQTTLTLTDRLAIRIYVNTSNRTITLHTENGHLCQVITTFTTGLTALNGLTSQVQYFATGTSGTDFNISSVTDTHTFNLPTASATNRGALSSANWTTFNNKQNAITLTTSGTSGASTLVGSTLNIPQYQGVLTNPITGTGVGTSSGGRVPYFTGTTTQVGSDNLWWDNTNARLGIGTASPSFRLDVNGTARVGASLDFQTTGINRFGIGYSTSNSINRFYVYNASGNTEPLSIFQTSSNILINGGFAPVDAGFRLDVNGTARVQSTLKVGATTTQNTSAVLDVESTTRGFLPPRMTTAQRDLISSPAAGLVIYNTSTNKHQGYNGTTWNDFY